MAAEEPPSKVAKVDGENGKADEDLLGGELTHFGDFQLERVLQENSDR